MILIIRWNCGPINCIVDKLNQAKPANAGRQQAWDKNTANKDPRVETLRVGFPIVQNRFFILLFR